MSATILNSKFSITSATGGEQSDFPAANLLQLTDETVYCTATGVNCVVELKAEEKLMVSEVVIRGPIRGFGEPVRCGIVQAGGYLEANQFDDMDVEEEEEVKKLPENVKPFVVDEFLEAVVRFAPPRMVDTVSIKFLETHGEGENVDLTFVAIIGSMTNTDEKYLRDTLNVLRPNLDPGKILPLGSVLHHIGRSPMVIAVGEPYREILSSIIGKTVFPGWVWTEEDSKIAGLLRRQFQSPEGGFISVLHEGGQYVMGGGDPLEFLEKCKRMLLENSNECCEHNDCGHDHREPSATTHETKSPQPSENPYLNTSEEITAFATSHPVSLIVYTAPWCSASARSIPHLPQLPTALVNIDTYPGSTPEVTPTVGIYSKGVLVKEFDELTRQGTLNIELLEKTLKDIEA